MRFSEMKPWRRCHALAVAIYRTTRSFPVDERVGLALQLRKAAASAAAQLARGSVRMEGRDYERHLNAAESALAEVESLLRLVRDLGYATRADVDALCAEAGSASRMVRALRRRLAEARLVSVAETVIHPN